MQSEIGERCPVCVRKMKVVMVTVMFYLHPAKNNEIQPVMLNGRQIVLAFYRIDRICFGVSNHWSSPEGRFLKE